jgi:hypothetical protein
VTSIKPSAIAQIVVSADRRPFCILSLEIANRFGRFQEKRDAPLQAAVREDYALHSHQKRIFKREAVEEGSETAIGRHDRTHDTKKTERHAAADRPPLRLSATAT